jgi:hypothetical protein
LSLLTLETSLKSHLIAVVLMAALVFGGIWGVESLIAKHDAANETRFETILKAAQDRSAKDEAQLQGTLLQVAAENASLTAQIVKNNQTLAAKQKVDAALPAPQLAAKLGGTAPDANTIDLPLNIARGIQVQLDSIPVLQSDLVDETKIAANLQTQSTQQTGVIADLQVQITDQTKVCQAQVASVKAQARKSKLKWFGVGFVLGVIAGHAAGF